MAGKRREAEIESAGAAIMSSGFGESRIFAAPEGTFPDERDWLTLTINGEPIPESAWRLIPYRATDQGAAEMNAGKEPARVRVTRDRTAMDQIPQERMIEKFRDDLEDDGEFQVAVDPFKIPMQKHTPVGHHGLFISKKKADQEGLIRNGMEYKPVLVKNPTTGVLEPVTVGGQFLASVPDEIWRKSQRHFAGLNREKQVSTIEKVQEQADRVMSEGGLKDLARRKRALEDLAGVTEDDPETADRELLQHEAG